MKNEEKLTQEIIAQCGNVERAFEHLERLCNNLAVLDHMDKNTIFLLRQINAYLAANDLGCNKLKRVILAETETNNQIKQLML